MKKKKKKSETRQAIPKIKIKKSKFYCQFKKSQQENESHPKLRK